MLLTLDLYGEAACGGGGGVEWVPGHAANTVPPHAEGKLLPCAEVSAGERCLAAVSGQKANRRPGY